MLSVSQTEQKGPHPRVLRSVSVVSLMTAVSRVLGLVREVTMAYFFGTSALKSAFDIAFIVPNLFRRLFGEGALSSAFVPVFGETLIREGHASAFRFGMRVISMLTVVLGFITTAGILLSFPLARMLPPESRWLIPLPMLRVMLPYALLICIAALLSGMLNTLGKFAIASLTPFLLNLIWIVTLLVVCPFVFRAPEQQIQTLSWAILLAGLAQILFQLPALGRHGFRFRLRFRGMFHDPGVKRVLYLMGPASLGIGLIQINVCIDKVLAFWADPAAPAALEYAERLIYLPLGVFGTAFMTVLLPTFSRQASAGELPAMQATLERSLRNLSVIMAPCSAALFVLALPVILLVYSFRGGRFDETSALLSARALAAYAPGLLVFSFQKAITPAFYGLQDLRTPVRVSLCALVLNITLNVFSVLWLPHGWKHVGIAGSTVLTSLVNAVALVILLRRRTVAPRREAVIPTLLKAVGCSLVMAVGVWRVCTVGMRWADGLGEYVKGAQIGVMALTVLCGVILYGGLMVWVGRGAVWEMVGEFRRRPVKGVRQ